MAAGNPIASRLSAALAGRADVELALLFGSHARGQARADSDVDIAILAPGVDRLQLAADLSQALVRDVDIVTLDDPSIALLEALVRDSVVVHEGRRHAGARWRSRTLIDLENDRPAYARMREAWLARVAAKGL